MIDNNYPTPTNGKPYYCAVCGLGFHEFMVCSEYDCKLETVEAAEKRRDHKMNSKKKLTNKEIDK